MEYDLDDPASWPAKRLKKAELAVSVWSDIKKLQIPNFDLNNPPPFHAPFPPGLIGSDKAGIIFPGMSPSNIKDEKLRKEYEELIKQHKIDEETYFQQRYLNSTDESYSRHAEMFLIKAYSSPPFNLPELKELLDKHNVGLERKKRILDAVITQMKHVVEGATSLSDTPPALPSVLPSPEAR